MDRRRLRRAFDSGRYPIALLLNEAVRGAREDGDEWGLASETLNYQLSARAGIAGLKPLNLDDFCGSGLPPQPRARLHVASHQSNRGELEAAKATFDRARRESAQTLKYPRLDLALRRAQIERTRSDAMGPL